MASSNLVDGLFGTEVTAYSFPRIACPGSHSKGSRPGDTIGMGGTMSRGEGDGMHRWGVIDIGSSAVKAALFEVDGDSPPRFLHESDPVATGLGRGLTPGGPLDAEAVARSLDALTAFDGEIRERGGRLRVVLATEALRLARDRERFLEAAKGRVEGRVSVVCIDAAMEARYAFQSAHVAFPDLAPGSLIVDPGGSSLDLCRSPTGRVEDLRSLSLPFGMNHLMAVAPPERADGRLNAHDLARLRATSEEALRPLTRWLDEQDGLGSPLVATSGAALAAAGVKRRLASSARIERIPLSQGALVTTEDLERMVEECHDLGAGARRALHPCLSRSRAPIFVHGTLALGEVLRAAGVTSCRVNAFGMKLGALVDAPSHEKSPEI